MGLSLGLLGALGGAASAAESDWNDQQKRTRDLNDYEQKGKFAETLQEKLMQRKMELAQQYPAYTHFVTDSVTGDTRGYTPYGQVATLSQGDPAQKQLYEATRDATMAQKNAAAAAAAGNTSLIPLRAGLLTAQTHKANADADKAERTPTNKDKPMSAAAYKTELMMRAHAKDPPAWAKLGTIDALDSTAGEKQASRQQAAINAAKAEMDAEGVHINEGLLQPPQEADGNDGNDFLNAGDDSDTDLGNF